MFGFDGWVINLNLWQDSHNGIATRLSVKTLFQRPPYQPALSIFLLAVITAITAPTLINT